MCTCCRCASFKPEHYYCRGDYMLKVRVNGKTTIDSDNDRSMVLPASYYRLTAYDIDIKQVFKANETIKCLLQSEPKIWVDGFAAQCGTTLFKGHEFVIAGRVRENKLWASACGYARDITFLSANDKKFFDEKKFETIDCELS